ncbi:MAG: amidohydrolase family protein [Bacteroidia bacterium]|nr:amidohydrolase family protein [Bacteroidia bacterium]MCF8427840.1 amidohydrolase family protein [Bacteroidia bacterium]MCF8447731.1 amidohydrolase family protein [Bacteroidia bacterium]
MKNYRIYPHLFFALLLLFTWVNSGCKFLPSTHLEKASKHEELIAIKEVTLLPMTKDGKPIEKATIVIKGNKIISINEPIPSSAKVINGKGKFLIPGLIDMHVHTPTDGHFNATFPTHVASIFKSTQDIMTPYLANGVTTIFELNAMAGHFGQRNEILSGNIMGPRMALAALINGGNGSGRIANTPEEGRVAVRMAKADGYEFIKVYSQLNKETFYAIVEEAKQQNLKVIGHLPKAFKGNTIQAFVTNFGMVAHAEEIYKQLENEESDKLVQILQLAKQNGTWICPTLYVISAIARQSSTLDSLSYLHCLPYVHPLLQSKWLSANNYAKNATPNSITRLHKMMEFNKLLVSLCKEMGIPMVAGTDAGTSGVVWGFSLHEELKLLVDAGLSPMEALSTATRLPAIWLGLEGYLGTIEVGKFADLILLDANPLVDIENTKKIAGVFLNGKWISKQQIKKMLHTLASHNESLKNKYNWSNRNTY